MRYQKTQWKDSDQCLLYSKLPDNSGWSFYHKHKTDNPSRVGAIYASKSELLADCYRYGKSWGF